ncbi:hypothetical protein [Lutibacter sp.]
MKATSLKRNDAQPHLKIVNNNISAGRKKKINHKLYINTLMPGFNYTNHLGQVITPKKCVLL